MGAWRGGGGSAAAAAAVAAVVVVVSVMSVADAVTIMSVDFGSEWMKVAVVAKHWSNTNSTTKHQPNTLPNSPASPKNTRSSLKHPISF
ncbi:hypothetical protein E2C01_100967 [Portunus trituberculatus]|uniref:Uncharacterized protein n=1 Tax=Portunus trituberculatus TaxID=210409 RepID=A0A5B7KEE8_PORTR|nr:hypothetical protein [Portunus trituberculatus]